MGLEIPSKTLEQEYRKKTAHCRRNESSEDHVGNICSEEHVFIRDQRSQVKVKKQSDEPTRTLVRQKRPT